MTGTYGQIKLNDGAEIVLSENASLYAYGYIIGNGTVIANDKSNVNEYFQIADFRGGNATLGMISGKVFPFSQFYIQNILAKLRLYSGATETVHTALTVLGSTTVPVAVPFIGKVFSKLPQATWKNAMT